MEKHMENKEYKEGLAYLSSALKSSKFDNWSRNKNHRYTTAIDRFNKMVKTGEKPIVAAKSVIDSYASYMKRIFRYLPRPKLLEGRKDDYAALLFTETKTAKKVLLGKMTMKEYKSEMKIIRKLKNVVVSIENIPDDLKDTKDESKERIDNYY